MATQGTTKPPLKAIRGKPRAAPCNGALQIANPQQVGSAASVNRDNLHVETDIKARVELQAVGASYSPSAHAFPKLVSNPP